MILRTVLMHMCWQVNRLGRDPQRTNSQQRDVTENAIRTAHVSAEMLTRIISQSKEDEEKRKREGRVSSFPVKQIQIIICLLAWSDNSGMIPGFLLSWQSERSMIL